MFLSEGPEFDQLLAKRVEVVINDLRIGFLENGGELDFIKVENGIVFVHFIGSYLGYPKDREHVRNMLENHIRQLVPEIVYVQALADLKPLDKELRL